MERKLVGINNVFCTRCGSTSHTSYDCSAPDKGLAAPKAVEAEAAAEPAVTPVEPDKDAPALSAKPRHPAWPLTCRATGLQAFRWYDAVLDFADRWCPSYHVKDVQKCSYCRGWHLQVHEPKASKYPRTPFVPFRRKPMRESAFGPQSELPQRKAEPSPERKAVRLPRREPKKEGSLF